MTSYYTEARSSVPVWRCNSWGVGIGTSRVAGSTPGLTLSGNNLGQVVHQAVQFGTGQEAVMPCGWEGDRRSGVALAMRHRLQWFIYLRTHGLRKGDVHPAYTPREVWHTFYLYLTYCIKGERL